MDLSFDELCALLQSSDETQYNFAVCCLCQQYPAQSAALILNTLRKRSESIRYRTFSAIARYGGGQAVEALLPYLRAKEIWIRCFVVDLLPSLPDRKMATASLFACLNDEAWMVRCRVAHVLEDWADPRAIEKLIVCLQDGVPQVRAAAAEALSKQEVTLSVEALVACLKDSMPQVRSMAAYALGFIGSERAARPLLACLQDPAKEVRRNAIYALGRCGSQHLASVLLPFLHDTERDVRAGVAEILGMWGDGRMVEPLLARLRREREWQVREWLIWALARIRDERAVEPLMLYLQDGKAEVRRQAAWALGRLRDPRAIEALRACLRDGEMRSEVVNALENLGYTLEPTDELMLPVHYEVLQSGALNL
ncbi:HEAT repeat domain-containing protein [Ktedonosporobacter rubrisoli]|uniref:HEAT repeat domain-containing protein n=1 Tax=Ktedonosporobacter rubrisoli TaxID=2509675 RepID=A0A4V0YZJ0_KTERU|nr:HEAT repeat domain-containing protein [Ktedonosporobacter rubrisoli]QBD79891.1 HEAT repeat domain-containing protein [Ktedonosporobacter rubrisoli]